jgi:hypothetical protein
MNHRLDESAASAVEMPGHGKSGKPNCGFPLFPQPLENALRFPHSHSVDDYCSLLKKHTERSPAPNHLHRHPSGSFFDEKMLVNAGS